MTRRIEKINKLLKQQISEAILKNLEFKKETMITVTRVETSTDFNCAKAKVSIIPFNKAEKILEILKIKKGTLQKSINKNLEMKKVPKIRFVLDKTEQKASRVEQLIKKMHKDVLSNF